MLNSLQSRIAVLEIWNIRIMMLLFLPPAPTPSLRQNSKPELAFLKLVCIFLGVSAAVKLVTINYQCLKCALLLNTLVD